MTDLQIAFIILTLRAQKWLPTRIAATCSGAKKSQVQETPSQGG